MLKTIFLNHDGTGHKVAHNLTTLANIPLVAWFIYAVFTLRAANYAELQIFMAQPVNLVAAVIFVAVLLKHFMLEIEVVLEDYISNISKRHASIIALKTFSFVLGVTSIISILKIGL